MSSSSRGVPWYGPYVPDTASLVLIKSFNYRDQAEEWSNKYHFEGTIPADANAWQTLATGWINEEKHCYTSATHVVRAYGYEPGSNHANWVHDYAAESPPGIPGDLTVSTAEHPCPGDSAATIRWSTGEYNSRGKLIYARKYMHGVWYGAAGPDHVADVQLAAYNQYATIVTSGFFPGSAKYCGPQGADLRDPRADPFITTRTLKRRGKRPLP
jgi:hypothetical protein